jgi:2-polyprenyl-3-methyl-5-hydroxy-6-metoxy-1,4-benzoquinol methylase
MNKFIEYYGKHEISPVKQDLSDINIHYAKREKLYRQLGIPCIAFEGKHILEVGPGGGYNSLAFLAWGGQCLFIEPNQTGVKEMRKLFGDYRIPSEQYEIKECTIEEAHIQEQFDIVIAEGFLHSIDNAEEIVKNLSLLVKNGGVIVITCMDSLSMFVEQIKRLVCHILIKDIFDYNKQVETCVDFFEAQMKSAKGMSRSVEDWVKDDMLNPAFNNDKILTLEKAIQAFPEDFSVLGSSQKIFTDYSWYKDLNYKERNEVAHQYKIKRHNFLMTGLEETILSDSDSEFLEQEISEIRSYAVAYEKNHLDKYLEMVREHLSAIQPLMSKIDRRCVGFVENVIEILDKLRDGKSVEFEKMEFFYSAVGRTQQYLSMVKNRHTALKETRFAP